MRILKATLGIFFSMGLAISPMMASANPAAKFENNTVSHSAYESYAEEWVYEPTDR